MTRKLKDVFDESLLRERSFDSLHKVLKPLGAYSEVELSRELPVKTPKAEWEQLESPTRMRRTFEFRHYEDLMKFTQDVLEFQNKKQHHGTLQINPEDVVIEVYTHDLNDITDVDISYAQEVGEIYKDVMFGRQLRIKRKNNEF